MLLLNNISLGGTIDPSTPDKKYIEFGKKFESVVRIKAKIKSNHQFGSAVIIKPHWALTAAHVVIDTEEKTILGENQEYPITKIIIHEKFEENDIGHNDIALCYSPEDFKLNFYTPLYTDHNELGKQITIAGYGSHGTFLTGAKESDGIKRAGSNVIDGIEKSILICTPSTSGKTALEFMIAPGDSGGGMFIGNKLAGINSFLMAKDKKPDGTYTDESAFTRISLYADWIEQNSKD